MGGDPAKGFVIGGISAGGNLAAVISHLYRDEKMSPPLTGIYLSVPILVSPEAVPGEFEYQYLSREQNKNAPILNKEVMALFRGMLRPYIVLNLDFGMTVHDPF
jgi:acetyl esterase/lipase